MCEALRVERVSDAHHAGSDALPVFRFLEKIVSTDIDFVSRIHRLLIRSSGRFVEWLIQVECLELSLVMYILALLTRGC